MTINIVNNIILERIDEYGRVSDVNFPAGSTLVGTAADTLVEKGRTYTTIRTSDGYFYVGLELTNTDFFSVV